MFFIKYIRSLNFLCVNIIFFLFIKIVLDRWFIFILVKDIVFFFVIFIVLFVCFNNVFVWVINIFGLNGFVIYLFVFNLKFSNVLFLFECVVNIIIGIVDFFLIFL